MLDKADTAVRDRKKMERTIEKVSFFLENTWVLMVDVLVYLCCCSKIPETEIYKQQKFIFV
jgi:hypothetical protein